MEITRIAAAAVFGGALCGGLVTASPAVGADSDVTGTYTLEGEDAESATWNVTLCPGDAPGCLRVFESDNAKRAAWNGEARYSVGSWIMFVQQPDAIRCEDGSTAPGMNTYSWDAASLSGSASILTRGACGDEASISIPFTLTKTGSGPVQYPSAPVMIEPYIVDIPEPYVPPAGEPAPAAALPAESDPALIATPPVIAPPPYELTEAEVAEPGFNADPGRR
jgi:hypothetical protein